MVIEQSKQEVRKDLRCKRKALPLSVRKIAEKRINQRLKKYIRRNSNIAVYRAVGSEVNLQTFIDTALKRHANIFEPIIEKNTRRLQFVAWGKANTINKRNIPKFRIEDMQIALLPLIGVDKAGNRLGQGGGYYDTSLSFVRYNRPWKIGIGFACQMLPKVPHNSHDKKLDLFISETQEHIFR